VLRHRTKEHEQETSREKSCQSRNLRLGKRHNFSGQITQINSIKEINRPKTNRVKGVGTITFTGTPIGLITFTAELHVDKFQEPVSGEWLYDIQPTKLNRKYLEKELIGADVKLKGGVYGDRLHGNIDKLNKIKLHEKPKGKKAA
jgi:hypothetical protein